MVQIAILGVLIVIAVILAPWLIAVIAALVIAYGAWVVMSFVVMAAFVVAVVVAFLAKESLMSFYGKLKIRRSHRIETERLREKAKKLNLKSEAQAKCENNELAEPACWFCGAVIEKSAERCPSCNNRQTA